MRRDSRRLSALRATYLLCCLNIKMRATFESSRSEVWFPIHRSLVSFPTSPRSPCRRPSTDGPLRSPAGRSFFLALHSIVFTAYISRAPSLSPVGQIHRSEFDVIYLGDVRGPGLESPVFGACNRCDVTRRHRESIGNSRGKNWSASDWHLTRANGEVFVIKRSVNAAILFVNNAEHLSPAMSQRGAKQTRAPHIVPGVPESPIRERGCHFVVVVLETSISATT